MTIHEEPLTGAVKGTLLTPDQTTGLGVVVLHGSSGIVSVDRARLFAAHGAIALAQRWSGSEGLFPILREVPLETFTAATDFLLKAGCNRIAFVGTSKGAEAALLAAVDDPRIDAVIAISPSSLVWAGDQWPLTSSWTRGGAPLPFVEVDFSDLAVPPDGRISYLSCFLKSLQRFADQIPAAAIPIEQAHARVILVAGGDDALWPSELFARSLADRLIAAGKHPLLITHPEAGHRVLLPGETTQPSQVNAHGGTDEADRELGRAAWHAIAEVLHFPA